MKRYHREFLLGAALIALSALFYWLHYLLFHDAHHIFIFLVGDVAFVFIEVLMVTLIIHRVLDERERMNRLQKLNMVVGAFYNEVGTKLLGMLSQYDPKGEELKEKMTLGNEWSVGHFLEVRQWLPTHAYKIDMERVEWEKLKEFFHHRRSFLLRLLENPNLLEHEDFTEMLQALFHVVEELEARPGFTDLPEADYHHMSGDIRRVYGHLTEQWLRYMEHLKDNYPYLFSLALRTNPFDEEASPVITE